MKIKLQNISGATFALIELENSALTVLVDEPRDPAWSLKESADEMRRKADAMNRRANAIEEAAIAIAAGIANL